MDKPIKKLTDEEKATPLPADAHILLKELKGQQLSPQAQEDLRAYARFYLWAIPLFDLKQINISTRTVEFGMMISKRFMVGMGVEGIPRIEVQPSEMEWMHSMPWAYAGVHFKSGRIMLVSRPEKPLSSSGFVILVDIPEKLEGFKDKRFLDIHETHFFNTPFSGRKKRLELREIDDGFFTKKKHKNKMA